MDVHKLLKGSCFKPLTLERRKEIKFKNRDLGDVTSHKMDPHFLRTDFTQIAICLESFFSWYMLSINRCCYGNYE